MRFQLKRSDIRRCERLLGYTFGDPALLEIALTHSSIASTRLLSNERLEFLGDAVLGLVICEKLFRDEQEFMEGPLTKAKSVVVSRRTCAVAAEETGLCELLNTGKGFDAPELPQSLSAGLLESVIGAIYLDGGLAPAADFILRVMDKHLQSVIANEHTPNYKSLLQQHAQREWGGTPTYELLDEKGPDHAKAFEISVLCKGRRYPSAWGASKKQAEQLAARAALIEVGQLSADHQMDGAQT